MEKQVSGEEFNRINSASSRSNKPSKQIHVHVGYIIGALLIVASFFGGVLYEKHHVKSTAVSASSSQRGTYGSFGGRFGGGTAERGLRAFGTVSAISSSSITITSNYGSSSSTTLAINSSTKITDAGQTVTYSSIQTGDTVIATKSSTSSTTATAIIVNPQTGANPGGPNVSSGSNTTGSSDDGSASSN